MLKPIDGTRALRLVLAGINEDASSADIVLTEALNDGDDGGIRLAMAAADLTMVLLTRLLGTDTARATILHDLNVGLDAT
jgi:hypothetical protein